MTLEQLKEDVEQALTRLGISSFVVKIEETKNYFHVSFGSDEPDLYRRISVPKKYNNLWPLRVERAVKETIGLDTLL